MASVTWVITNCNTNREALKIGRDLMRERLVACFDVFLRVKTSYFWPPKTGKIEGGKGAMLVLVTLPQHVKAVSTAVKKLHSDKTPFIGTLKLNDVNQDYCNWLTGELAAGN